MARRGSKRRRTDQPSRWAVIGLAVLALVVIGGSAVGWARYERAVDGSTATANVPLTEAPAPSPDELTPPDLGPVPPRARVVVLGDSWSAGYGLDEPTRSYAYLASEAEGWMVRVIPGGSGTGYIHGDPPVLYGARLANEERNPDVDLVILQGGLNDAPDVPHLPDRLLFNRAVENVIVKARQKYPSAQIVVLGPLSPTIPSSDDPGLEMADARLLFSTQKLGVPYISPMADGWVETAREVRTYFDPAIQDHPSPEGHRYLAEQLLASIGELGG